MSDKEHDALLDMLDAANAVVNAWESGDLAGAVNELRITAEAIRVQLEIDYESEDDEEQFS